LKHASISAGKDSDSVVYVGYDVVMNSSGDSNDKTEKIVQKLADCMPAILLRYPVISAYLYGSQVAGFTHPDSDIDIAIYVKPGSELTLNQELDIGREIEQSSGLKPVELRALNGLP
jgi:predicted nucleotidyltransferase